MARYQSNSSVDARDLTTNLNGRWYGSYGVAACPVCQPQKRRDQHALTIADGHDKLLVHCKKSGCSFLNIMDAAGVNSGEWRTSDAYATRRNSDKPQIQTTEYQARRLWSETQPIGGTPAENYLRGRSVTVPLPKTLRYAPSCWHLSKEHHPAMVALVEGSGAFSVHRTYLRADGTGKADVEPAKVMLGASGGGAVRLTDGPGPLVVAEGIETALSLACGLLRYPATIWAALSTSGMRSLHLPSRPGRLTIAVDGDSPGREAAYSLASHASALGWNVSMLTAPDGKDWNDVLRDKAVAK